MIRAYILIKTNHGNSVKYVRDVVADTNGVNELFYRYRGNGYQDAGLNIRSTIDNTGLLPNTTYYFQVNVDGAGLVEYSVKTSQITSIYKNDNNNVITWTELIPWLNSISSDFEVFYADNDIRFRSNTQAAATSIALAQGATSPDLFSALNGWTVFDAAQASDNYFDQTLAGQVQGDFAALTTSIETPTNGLVLFPDSTPTTTLVRTNRDNGKDDLTKVIREVRAVNVSETIVVEEIEENAVYTYR